MWKDFREYLLDLKKSGCKQVRVYYNKTDDEILFMGDINLSTYTQMWKSAIAKFNNLFNKQELGYLLVDINEIMEKTKDYD